MHMQVMVARRGRGSGTARSHAWCPGPSQFAKHHQLRALHHIISLWSEYDLHVPDLDRVFTIAGKMSREISKGHEHYARALEINPKSVMALRK